MFQSRSKWPTPKSNSEILPLLLLLLFPIFFIPVSNSVISIIECTHHIDSKVHTSDQCQVNAIKVEMITSLMFHILFFCLCCFEATSLLLLLLRIGSMKGDQWCHHVLLFYSIDLEKRNGTKRNETKRSAKSSFIIPCDDCLHCVNLSK